MTKEYDIGYLYTRWRPLVVSVALRVLHDEALAEDVAQEVFLSAMTKLDRSSPRPRIVGWLKRVAFTKSLDQLRLLSRRGTSARDSLEGPDVVATWGASREWDPATLAEWRDDSRPTVRAYIAVAA